MALLGATGQPIQCTVTRDVKGRRTDFLAARSAHAPGLATFPTSCWEPSCKGRGQVGAR